MDILIANAGMPAAGRLETFTLEQVDRTLDVNLRAPIVLAHALLPAMLERGRGHLLFMSSIAGKMTVPGASLYHATKYGLRGFAAAPARRPARQRRRRLMRVPRLHPRRRHLRRRRASSSRRGTGTRSPEDVARAVVDAIEHDRGEVDVASLAQRGGAVIAGLAPDISANVVRRLGGRIAGIRAQRAWKR